MCNYCLGVIIKDFDITLALKIRSSVCTPKFEGYNICEDFEPKNRDDYFSLSNEKFKYSFCDWFLDCLWIQHVI